MTLFDLVVGALLLLSALIGLSRGFVREALGLCAWVGAALLATQLTPQLLPWARRTIGDDSIADPFSFVLVFVVLLIAFLLIAGALGGLARGSLLGGLDRLLGFGFGLLRGGAVLVIAFLLVAPLLPPAGWPALVRRSRSLPFIHAGAIFAAARLPDRFRPDLDPPSGRSAPAAAPPDHAL